MFVCVFSRAAKLLDICNFFIPILLWDFSWLSDERSSVNSLKMVHTLWLRSGFFLAQKFKTKFQPKINQLTEIGLSSNVSINIKHKKWFRLVLYSVHLQQNCVTKFSKSVCIATSECGHTIYLEKTYDCAFFQFSHYSDELVLNILLQTLQYGHMVADFIFLSIKHKRSWLNIEVLSLKLVTEICCAQIAMRTYSFKQWVRNWEVCDSFMFPEYYIFDNVYKNGNVTALNK